MTIFPSLGVRGGRKSHPERDTDSASISGVTEVAPPEVAPSSEPSILSFSAERSCRPAYRW